VQFRQLEYLVVLSREKHFTRAADACAVSQPALSEAIRKLEIELDLPLIARFPMEGVPSEAGQAPPDAGIAPDLIAIPTAQDIAQGRDVAKTAVRRALEATR